SRIKPARPFSELWLRLTQKQASSITRWQRLVPEQTLPPFKLSSLLPTDSTKKVIFIVSIFRCAIVKLNLSELQRSSGYARLILCGVIVILTWTVFGQTLNHDFINLDDPFYVSENPNIQNGLNWRSIAWAFTHVHSNNWHPLTTISHMLDCQ